MTGVSPSSRSRIAAVLLLCAGLLLSGTATDPARAGAASERRADLLQHVNATRDRKDRDALALDQELSRYAARHARAMARAGELFHTADLREALGHRDWSVAGENVGAGRSLEEVHDAFMRSKPHRRNVLGAGFDHVAIGVAKSDGNLWVTLIFYG